MDVKCAKCGSTEFRFDSVSIKSVIDERLFLKDRYHVTIYQKLFCKECHEYLAAIILAGPYFVEKLPDTLIASVD